VARGRGLLDCRRRDLSGIVPHAAHGQTLARHPQLARWFEAVAARPATRRVYDGVEDIYSGTPDLSSAARSVLFGEGMPALKRAC
jgi:GST-like protein